MAEGLPETAERALGEAETVESDAPQTQPPPAADDPLVGRMLHHFRIDGRLGAGGMGTVYRGWDTALERPVAIKVLVSDRPDARARFVREARTQAKLRHPNVVPIHFVGEAEGVAFLSMDIVEGESLSDRIRRERRLSADVALRIAKDVAAALAAGANVGLVHRDVKPSNILLDPSGRVLLADFGLAKVVSSADPAPDADDAPAGSAELTRAGAILGTPAYMAPEQTRGDACDHRADVYALGVTLYEAITGELPFTAPTTAEVLEQHRTIEPLPPRTLRPDLSPAVQALVLRMMAKKPADRFAGYAELVAAIDAVAAPKLHAAGLMSRGGAFVADLAVFAIPAAVASNLIGNWLGAVVLVLAFGLVEGRWGRTVGKYLLALRTVGPHDLPPGYPRSFARAAVKLWGALILPLTIVLPAGGLRSTADVIIAAGWAVGLLVAAGRSKAALHDRWLRTRVVYALRS